MITVWRPHKRPAFTVKNLKRSLTLLLLALYTALSLFDSLTVSAFTGCDQISINKNTSGFDQCLAAQNCSTSSTDATAQDTTDSATGISFNDSAAQKIIKSSGATVGYAVYDSAGKQLANYKEHTINTSASISKSLELVAYLQQVGSNALDSDTSAQLTAMIEKSDNTAANQIFNKLGGQPANHELQASDKALAAVTAVAKSAGMTDYKAKTELNGVNLPDNDGHYALGYSLVSADDFAKFFAKIDTLMPGANKAFGMNLLANVSEHVGLLQVNLPGTVYSKEGWNSEGKGFPGAPYVVNQAAQFSNGGTAYGIAITVGGVSNQIAGEGLIKQIGTALISTALAQPKQSTAQQIASTFVVGFNARGTNTQAIMKDLASKYHIGGTYLIGASDHAVADITNNAEKEGYDKSFYDSLNTLAGKTLVTASDEEGAVTRYSYGSVNFPTAKQMAQKSENPTTIGKNVGKVMAGYGLTADLGPVLDLRDVGDLPGRSFSSNPSVVAEKAGDFAAGLQASGISPVFKHFPGFDSTTSGTTDTQKVVMKGSIDNTVAPYQKLLKKYPKAGLMLSNMYVNKLDVNNPSSLSTATVNYVRKTLGFSGMITTDDLSVSSVTNKAGSLGAAVADALQAGVSMPLFTLNDTTVKSAENSLDTIIAAVQKNTDAMSTLSDNSSIITSFTGNSAPVTTPTADQSASADSGCCAAATTIGKLSGSSNAEKIFNYLSTTGGLSQIAAAGVMGNMNQESSLNPAAQQNPGAWEDMSDLDVNHGGKGGVGLVQWDGGRRPKFINYATSHGVPLSELEKPSDAGITIELQYVMLELHDSYKTALSAIQAATTPGAAAEAFNANYERSSDGPAAVQQRADDATGYYTKYGSSAPTPASSTATFLDASSSSSCDQSVTPVCTSAQGVAKILCAAKAYDGGSYVFGAAHSSAPDWEKTHCTPITSTCTMDCSGLVNLAVYDAFKVDLQEDTDSERADSTHWQKVTLNQAQPGDLIQPDSGHVEVIANITGKGDSRVIHTFGAHESGIPQPDQINPSQYSYNSNTVLLHYIGKTN